MTNMFLFVTSTVQIQNDLRVEDYHVIDLQTAKTLSPLRGMNVIRLSDINKVDAQETLI